MMLILALNMCRQLTELALLFCQKIGNNALVEIGRGCNLLQALHLVDCSGIGDEGICGIARGCRKLKKLHIRRCYEVLSLSLTSRRVLHILPHMSDQFTKDFIIFQNIPCIYLFSNFSFLFPIH